MPNKLIHEMQAYMEREKINQKEFAERINVSPSTISRIIKHGTSPSIEVLDRMAAAMGEEVMNLVYWYLDRPLPDVYEMARRAYALGSHDYARLSESALTLLQEQEKNEPLEKPVKRKTRKDVR